MSPTPKAPNTAALKPSAQHLLRLWALRANAPQRMAMAMAESQTDGNGSVGRFQTATLIDARQMGVF